ncbi:DUF4336 domain-containing protein [Oculatella sp. LEGE 06141]|uniref:DUF4336 domain-containing protein n=1 Tax=Oculatella sp. LEGE 06141 TaxID=1828648 RepID=UPI00187EC53E|nr:DUF4336 domain-containing protein [Oculatella sp. LEGE 06141]MBE9182676.1 DUF4336 domain-containing protein [Oculatella sp. LEGE 06141]
MNRQQERLPNEKKSREWVWPFWLTLPLYPYRKRQTLRQEVIKNTIWIFDQIQGILYTVVPIRMTVVKLDAGGLLVYAPVAPTGECVRLVNELVAEHGDVKYIVLPTSSGLEHKIFVGPFARRFPTAQVLIAPHQWSFPVNLPLSWLGFPQRRTQVLPEDSQQAPFAAEFEYAVLDINLGRGSFAEVALYHKRSRTLLLTDSILSIPEEPPAIVQVDPTPLLFHARDSALESVEDTEANRRKGWKRIALFAVYFRPSTLKTVGLGQALRDAFHAPDRSRKHYFGLFPFQWQPDWMRSFDALRGGGRPFVAPILQTLILPHAPQQVLDWANRVTQWNFQYIIPCHFDAPIEASPAQFRQAFAFLQQSTTAEAMAGSDPSPLPEEDFQFIRELEANLIQRGIATSPQPKV